MTIGTCDVYYSCHVKELKFGVVFVVLPDYDEVLIAITAINNNNTPGADSLPVELLKYDGEELVLTPAHSQNIVEGTHACLLELRCTISNP